MDRAELRAQQAPLKQRYREDASAAMVTMRASGRLGDGATCTVDGWAGPVRSGLHPAAGGTPENACSGDMLLEALVACAGVTMLSVAAAMGITVTGSVGAEGDMDFRGTLAVDRTVPVGFSAIRLTFDVETEGADEEARATLLRLTERYCVVLQSLLTAPEVSAAFG